MKTLQEHISEKIQNALNNGETYLKLTCCELDSIPPDIFKIKTLKSLDLSFNNIKDIPKEIFQLSNLETLDLYNNYIEKVPKDIKHLSKLRKLDLGFNKIAVLPDWIGQMESLKRLLITKNPIQYAVNNVGDDKHTIYFFKGKSEPIVYLDEIKGTKQELLDYVYNHYSSEKHEYIGAINLAYDYYLQRMEISTDKESETESSDIESRTVYAHKNSQKYWFLTKEEAEKYYKKELLEKKLSDYFYKIDGLYLSPDSITEHIKEITKICDNHYNQN